MYKHLFFVFSFFLILSGSGCTKDKQVLFTMNLKEQFNVPGGLNSIETHVFVIKDINSALDNYLSSQGLKRDVITKIGAGLAQLNGVFRDGKYGNVDIVEINLVDTEDPSATYEIFYQNKIPLNHTGTLDLFGSLTDITEIIQKKKYNLEIAFRFRNPTSLKTLHQLDYSIVVYGKN